MTALRLKLILLIAMVVMLGSGSVRADPPPQLRAVELTFLKSQPGQRENLKKYIVLNWFAMDKIARDQGLMQAFTVMDTGNDDGAWNVLVSVTYMDDKGYPGVAAAFEKIRSAHETVRVEGKSLRELGAIVESKRMFENPAHATR